MPTYFDRGPACQRGSVAMHIPILTTGGGERSEVQTIVNCMQDYQRLDQQCINFQDMFLVLSSSKGTDEDNT